MKSFENEIKNCINEILDVISDDLLISDGKGTVIKVSPDFEKVYGIENRNAIGRTVYELEEEGYFKPSVISKVLESGKRVTLPQKTKSKRDILVTATPVYDKNGEIKFVVSFSRDITEMVELQKKFHRLEDKMAQYTAELEELRKKEGKTDIIIKSAHMENIMQTIDRIADIDVNVLLLGPSGVGKTMLAKKIHNKSSRRECPFIDINCAAIPENLLESELFGYEKGAFTGASEKGKIGLIEMANGGTLLLDEISEIPITLQAKLLKVIQEKEITPIGGSKSIKVDFRLIAASNRELDKYAEEGKFRKDLFYRLNVVNIFIPPLCQRKEGIIHLINFFTDKYNKRYSLNKKLHPKTIDALVSYNWPGNIRELSNVIERIMVTSEGKEILPQELPKEITERKVQADYNAGNIFDLTKAIEDYEAEIIKDAYNKCHTTTGVAKLLNISQPTASRKIEKYINSSIK